MPDMAAACRVIK